MRLMLRRPFAGAVLAGGVAMGALPACGSRSQLEGTTIYLQGPPGGGMTQGDDAGLDGPADDATEAGADAPLPPIDATPLPDVVLANCSSPSTLYIYVVTEQGTLYSLDPRTTTLTPIGPIACPARAGLTPFSMAVDRVGVAYVLYSNPGNPVPDGQLFRVSTRTAQCQPTAFVPPSSTFASFGMGFVADSNGTTDTLYITPDAAGVLATLDTQTFAVKTVGPLSLSLPELTGTGDGRLFAFYEPAGSSSTAIAQLDPTTAAVVANSNLPGLSRGGGWAFGFWGGNFYLFTASGSSMTSPSIVTRFRPSDGSLTTVAKLTETVVGAGVSTCAPQM